VWQGGPVLRVHSNHELNTILVRGAEDLGSPPQTDQCLIPALQRDPWPIYLTVPEIAGTSASSALTALAYCFSSLMRRREYR